MKENGKGLGMRHLRLVLVSIAKGHLAMRFLLDYGCERV